MEELRWPERIEELVHGEPYTRNEVGMSGSQVFMYSDKVLKIQKRSPETDNESEVIRWISGRIPVPRILACETQDGWSYCLMSRVEGKMLCDQTYMSDPERLLDLLAEAFRLLWSIDPSDCPCDGRLEAKLQRARYRVEHGLVDWNDVDPETVEEGFGGPEELLSWLETHRPPEEPVLSHGDLCLPNVFADGDRITGFIDLGRMGIADRWQDIAICGRSLHHNFAGKYRGGNPYPGYRPELFSEMMSAKLGIREDPAKREYYRLMDELF